VTGRDFDIEAFLPPDAGTGDSDIAAVVVASEAYPTPRQ
jgi:hypothetical protein